MRVIVASYGLSEDNQHLMPWRIVRELVKGAAYESYQAYAYRVQREPIRDGVNDRVICPPSLDRGESLRES